MSTPRKRSPIPGNGRARPKPSEPKLRLVKAIVQPMFVLDDGKTLREVRANPVEVVGAEWEEWAAKAFTPASLSRMKASLDAPPPEEG